MEAWLEAWLESMNNLSSFGPDFLEDVIHLIESLGFQIAESDLFSLGFCVQKTEQEIKNACNVSTVPLELYQVAKGLIVADFLTMKKISGTIGGVNLDFEPILKELQEGDTKQVFAVDSVSSAEQRLDSFIALMNLGREQFIRFRRLQW